MIKSMQPDAPLGEIPKLGEVWRPVGRKAFVGSLFLVEVDKVQHLVPEEFSIVRLGAGRTLATVFIGDYGPGSTLAYHEFGIQPALVRFRKERSAWNSTLIVDTEDSMRGGMLLGVRKQLAEFDWQEHGESSGRICGECILRQEGKEMVRIRYEQGSIAIPDLPIKISGIRDDMVITCVNRFKGRHRLSRVRFEVPEGSPIAWLRSFGRPVLSSVATKMRGAMGDQVRVAGFLPHRNPRRLALTNS